MSPKLKRNMSKEKVIPMINPNVAGIDVGATELFVAVPGDRSDQPVRTFGTFTEDLLSIAAWLKSCGIKSVAMESTGVYWIPVFQILEDHGFEVCLVNAHHVKNVPGRKSDVSDCQWIQYLHSVGLLRGSFRPARQICAVRTIVRHRDALVKLVNVHIQHMQKALTQMNLQLHHVISDITGVTGLAIIQAILSGERDPQKLAAFRDRRIKASRATIAKSLLGDYRPELLFTLQQSMDRFQHDQHLITNCDLKITELLSAFDSQINVVETPLPKNDKINKPKKKDLELSKELYRITGVDLTAVPGLQATTVHVILSEIGTDVSKFPSGKHLASWLGLCPDNRISGGRILSVRTKQVANRAATALRMAATTLLKSQTPLGDFFRRMRTKMGTPKAITATAHKLALIIHHLLKTKEPYDHARYAQQQQENYKRRLETKLKIQAKSLGFNLVPVSVVS